MNHAGPVDEPSDLRLRKGQATRDRLVTAARDLFGRHGYEGTSIDAILQATGMQRGALYHHFATKKAIFDAVLDQLIAGIAERVVDAGRSAPDPAAGLRISCTAWLRISVDPAIQRIALLDSPAVLGWKRVRELDARHMLGRVRHNLGTAMTHRQATAPSAAEIDVLAHMLMAAIGEAALLVALSDEPQASLAAAEATLERFLDRLTLIS